MLEVLDGADLHGLEQRDEVLEQHLGDADVLACVREAGEDALAQERVEEFLARSGVLICLLCSGGSGGSGYCGGSGGGRRCGGVPGPG